MFDSRIIAWDKLKKTNITNFKKDIIFYELFEFELKAFLNTDKKTKLVKTLVTLLVHNNLTLEDVRQVLKNRTDKKRYNDLIKIGCIDNNYILYLETTK